jgi:hypothetical protein
MLTVFTGESEHKRRNIEEFIPIMLTQNEFEKAFAKRFKNGDLTTIARATGHDPKYTAAKFDPNNPEKVSDWYRAYQGFRALIDDDYANGSQTFAFFAHLVAVDTSESLCMQTELKLSKKEVDEWENTLIEGKSLETVESETLDVYFRFGQTLRSIARAKQQGNAA